jgi:hypothetical protein
MAIVVIPAMYAMGTLGEARGRQKDRLPLVSRLLTPEYFSLVCKFAFGIIENPDLQSINKYGGFNFSYPRLVIIGSEQDGLASKNSADHSRS